MKHPKSECHGELTAEYAFFTVFLATTIRRTGHSILIMDTRQSINTCHCSLLIYSSAKLFDKRFPFHNLKRSVIIWPHLTRWCLQGLASH